MPSPKDAQHKKSHANAPSVQTAIIPHEEDATRRSDSLLQLFIDYAWKDSYGACSADEARKFRNWVSSKKIDFTEDNWPSLLKPVNNRDCYYSRDWWIGTIPAIFHEIAYKLKSFLPILFRCKGDVNHADDEGRTILHAFLAHVASKPGPSPGRSDVHKDTRLVERLLEHGASVNCADKRGDTPFHMAARYGQRENVKAMLERFTNTATSDELGNTALHLVVEASLTLEGDHQKECAEVVQSLLNTGADLTRRNNKGLTPVQLAANKYNVEVLRVFEARGADFRVLTDNGENLVCLACRDKWRAKDESRVTKTIDFLVDRGCDVNEADYEGRTPLHYAALWDRAVKCLVEHGARLDSRTIEHQQTPLHWALKGYHFNVDTVKTLLDAGARIDARAADGSSPLLMAVMRSSVEIVRYLLEQGAEAASDKDDVYGFTPLHLAAFERDKFALLVGEKDVDVNAASEHGLTPLHLASLVSNVEVMKSLVARGASVDCRDDAKRTALHMILLGNFFLKLEDLVDGAVMVDEDAKRTSFVDEMWSSLWCRLCTHHHKDAIEYAVKSAMLDVNAKDANGVRPLHLATREPLGNSIETLLKLGADIDVCDHRGRMPIHEILENGNVAGLKCLLNYGMDVNERSINRLVISSKRDVKDVVFLHLVKLQAADLPIASVYKTHLKKAKYRQELSQYTNEVKRMKNYPINDSGVSLYAFLHMNWKRRVGLIPYEFNHKFVGFEYYQKIILLACREAVERRRLFEPAMDAWYRVTKYHLPDICVEHVFQYLSNRHLTALIDSAELNCDDKST